MLVSEGAITNQEEGNRSLRWLVAVGLCSTVLFFQLASEHKSTGIGWLCGLTVLQFAPLAISISRGTLRYIDLILPNHFLQFTLPRIHAYFDQEPVAKLPPELMNGLQQFIFCTLISMASYFVVRFFFPLSRDTKVSNIYLSSNKRTLLLVFILGYAVFAAYVPSGVAAVMSLLHIIACALIIASEDEENPIRERFLYVALVVAGLLGLLQSGMMTLLINVWSLFVISLFLRRRFRAFKWMALFFALIGLLQAVKYSFRGEIRGGSLDLVERAEVYLNLIGGQFLSEKFDENAQQKLVADSFTRVGDYSLETVLEQTPKLVPFWDGSTYETVPYMFIPRMIWPEKPSRIFYHEFGKVYGYLTENDFETSVAVSYLAEAYMNYGFPGLYGVAMLFGCLVALMEGLGDRLFGGRTIFGFAVFLTPVMYYSVDFGSMISTEMIYVVLALAMRWALGFQSSSDGYTVRPS